MAATVDIARAWANTYAPTSLAATTSIPTPTVTTLGTATVDIGEAIAYPVAATYSWSGSAWSTATDAGIRATAVKGTTSLLVPDVNHPLDTTATPTALALTTSIPIPAVGSAATPTAIRVNGTTTFPAPVLFTSKTATPSVVSGTSSLAIPAATGGGTPTFGSMFAEIRVRSGTNWANYSIARRYRELTFDAKYADTGTFSLSIPTVDAINLGLGDLSVIEIAPNGMSVYGGWYYVDGTSGTRVSDDELWTTYSGKSLDAMMDEGIVYPSAWPSATPAGHSFLNVSAGTILQTLITRAQQRGTLTWLDASTFTGTTSSSGVSWNTTVGQVTYDTGTGLFQVLLDLSARGMLSWVMNGRQLLVYNLDANTTHRKPEVATFRRGATVLDQARNTDSTEWASTALVVGDQNQAVERTSATNLSAIGRRREKYVAQSGISDGPTLQMVGDRYLSLAHLKDEGTIGVTDTTGPWINYLPGDWVWIDIDGTLVERQVRQIAAAGQDQNNLKIGLTLGDTIDQYDSKVARVLAAITNGGGAIPSPVTNDGGTPSAPTGVTAAPLAYQDANGIDHDQVTVSWAAPTTNTDNSPLSDLGHYDVQWHDTTNVYSPIQTVQGGVTVAYFSNITPGQTLTFQVRAVDNAGNASAWASSTAKVMPASSVVPRAPSTPVLVGGMRAVRVSWDGLDSTGASYGPSWAHTDVYMSTSNNFIPSQSTMVGSFSSPIGGRLLISVSTTSPYYAVLIAVDKSGNQSNPSVQSVGVAPAAIATSDLADKLVSAAKIADGSITTAQLSVSAFGDSVCANGTMEDPATATEDLATGLAHWKVVYWTGTQPVITQDATMPATGSASMHIAVADGVNNTVTVANSASGGASAGIPTSTGDVWYVRFKAKASRDSVVSVFARMSLSYDVAHSMALFDPANPWISFVGDLSGSGPNLPLTGAFGQTPNLGTTWQTYEGQLTVPVGTVNPLIWARLVLSTSGTVDNTAVDVWLDDVQVLPVKGTAFIADASIASAKITTLTADQITAGNLTAGDIVASTMSGASIDSSEISGTDFVIDDTGGTILIYEVQPGTTVILNGDAPGSSSWLNNTGFSGLAKIECWGGGGGGGCGDPSYGGAPGGAGGEYAREDLVSITSGQTYSFQIGAGGTGATASYLIGNQGSNSYFVGDSGKTVTAHGGGGSVGAYTVAGGTGSTNAVHFNGGKNNPTNTYPFHAGGNSGGTGAGWSATGFTGKSSLGNTGAASVTAPAGGGSSGKGGNGGSTHTAGSNGGGPGGGGGGGGAQFGGGVSIGGNGGNGRVQITYGSTIALVASIAAAGGLDQYGNAYPAGVWVRPVGSGNDVQWNFFNASDATNSGIVPAPPNLGQTYTTGFSYPAGNGAGPLRYYMDALGFVHMEGVITDSVGHGALTDTGLVLPVGWRPRYTLIIVGAQATTGGNVCKWQITSAGHVWLTNTVATTCYMPPTTFMGEL